MGNTTATGSDRAEHVECVVVGSGFGGSVAAYRLAKEGRSVVVLERGRPYPPGSFARTPAAMSRNFWDPSEGLHGLFDVWSFRGLEGIVSSGLGGGSLIYANVLLRKDERWFVHESPIPGGGYENWPVTRADLDPHYQRVETMLGATPYPYLDTPKTAAMREAAERADLQYQRPPLAVSFAPQPGADPVPGASVPEGEFPNLHGRSRQTCTLCGECDVGCNSGAKNTLDHTYLSAAKHHGADLRTLCDVRGVAPRDGGGYTVRYVVHEPDREDRATATDQLPLRTITCDRLVLAAGTFGTTYLLLRSRAALPGLSRALGTRFSGNGDLLGLMLRSRADVAAGGGARALEASHGPVITSAIRVGDELDGGDASGRGFYVQDAGYPTFVDWLAESTQIPGALRRAASVLAGWAWSRVTGGARSNVSRELAALLGPASLSDTSLPLLGMGRDVPDGVMRLRDGYLDVDWTTITSQRYFDRVRDTMREISEALGASFVDNPLSHFDRVITVHPLGGAPIGRHPGEAVCDGHGEVFGFDGLHVLDGAALPGPVGANPSLTIAALADRACDRILDGSGQSAPAASRTNGSQERPEPEPAAAPTAAPPTAATPTAPAPRRSGEGTSLEFTEEMKGHITLDETDPVTGADLGRSRGHTMMFRLTITVDDVDAFVTDPEHLGRAEGYVDCDVLGGRLPVVQGWFNLFTKADGADTPTRRMLYRLLLTTPAGEPLTFVGHKEVHDDPGLDVWSDTSTLYVRVLGGHVPPEAAETAADGTAADDGRVIGAAVLHILIPDFAVQLTTFRTSGPDPARALATFGRLFLGELWTVYRARFGTEVHRS